MGGMREEFGLGGTKKEKRGERESFDSKKYGEKKDRKK